MKKNIISTLFLGIISAAVLMVGCGASNTTSTAETETSKNTESSVESASGAVLPDGSYTATALTTHYAANCAAGIDYDSLYDISLQVKDGLISDITFDIGPNAKSVPETADISMEDWPFIKLSETQARTNLIGKPATRSGILNSWQIEKREDLAAKGIDVVSGATEACRASRDAIVNLAVMNDSNVSYSPEFHAKDALPNLVMFEGKVTGETTDEDGRVNKTVQINDGNYCMYGVVSAIGNEIDNSAVDYNYVIEVKTGVTEGKISSIECTTPNGSDADKKAVAEADAICKDKLVGIKASNDAINENIPYSSRSEESFNGSAGAKIAADMISNVLKNGCTHIIGWTY